MSTDMVNNQSVEVVQPVDFSFTIPQIPNDVARMIAEKSDETTRVMILQSIARHLKDPRELVDLLKNFPTKLGGVLSKVTRLFTPIEHNIPENFTVRGFPIAGNNIVLEIYGDDQQHPIISSFTFEGKLIPSYNPTPFKRNNTNLDATDTDRLKALAEGKSIIMIPGCTHGMLNDRKVGPHMGVMINGEVKAPFVNNTVTYDGEPIKVETDLVGGGIVWIDGECTFCNREELLAAAEENHRNPCAQIFQANWCVDSHNFGPVAMMPSRAFVPLEYNGVVQIQNPRDGIKYMVVNSSGSVHGYEFIHCIAKIIEKTCPGSSWNFAGFDYIGGQSTIIIPPIEGDNVYKCYPLSNIEYWFEVGTNKLPLVPSRFTNITAVF